jgi:Tol biopolymer transport system component
MQRLISAAIVMIFLAVSSGGAQAPDAERLYRAAMTRETVDADPKGAIELYKQAVAAAGANRSLAARALFRMAGCHEKLADGQAPKVLAQLVSAYADQPEAAEARTRLAAGQTTFSDGPFRSRIVGALIAKDEYFGAILPKISPDGKWIVFLKVHGVRTSTPDVSVCVRNLQTGVERVIAPGRRGDRQWVSWTDDSRRVAVSLRILEGQSTRREIVVADLASPDATPIVLSSVSGPREQIYPMFVGWLPMPWSRDGRHFPYLTSTSTSGIYEVQLFDATTGRSRSLGALLPADIRQPQGTPANAPPMFRWSPEGRQLAMLVGDATNETQHLRIVQVAEGSARTIPLPGETGSRVELNHWTGRGLVVTQRAPSAPQLRLVSLVDPSTGRLTRICEQLPAGFVTTMQPRAMSLRVNDTDLCLGVTRDGSSLLRWDVATQRIMVRDLASLQDRPLTRGSGEERGPMLLQDDRTVIFISNRDGRWAIYAAPLTGAPAAEPVLISGLDTLPSAFSVRPTDDGFVSDAAYWEGDVWRLDLDPATGRATGEPQRLTQEGNQNFLAAVSPDGKLIAYWSRHGYRMNLAVMDANGANERILIQTNQPTNHNYWTAPVWRSNEELLYTVYSPVGSGSRRFFTINVKDGTPLGRTFPELEEVPSTARRDWQFLPTRQEMVFVSRGDAGGPAVFRARPLSGGDTRVIATLDGRVGALEDFLVSPDGGMIAFAMNGKWQVYDVAKQSVAGHLGNFTTPTDWSRDGRFLLFSAGGPQLLDVATGRSVPVIQPAPREFDWTGEGSLAADRSFLVYWVPAVRSEWRQWHGLTTESVLKAMKAGK